MRYIFDLRTAAPALERRVAESFHGAKARISIETRPASRPLLQSAQFPDSHAKIEGFAGEFAHFRPRALQPVARGVATQ
jgi:hypothetical protein